MSKKLKLDFTGVENYGKVAEGQHVAKIASAEVKQSQGGNDMIVVAFEVTKGSDKGNRAYENYPLADNALWKLKGLLQAIGLKCDGKVQLDLDKLTGKVCLIEVVHEEYNGSTRAKVQECKKLAAEAEEDDEDELEDDIEDDDDEEEETPKKKAPAKKKAEPKKSSKKPEPEEDDDDDDEEWEDGEEWEDEAEEDEESAPKKKSSKAPAKKAPAKKAPAKKKKPVEEDDDDDDDDWDDEE